MTETSATTRNNPKKVIADRLGLLGIGLGVVVAQLRPGLATSVS